MSAIGRRGAEEIGGVLIVGLRLDQKLKLRKCCRGGMQGEKCVACG
jgi:hypothetical protein